METILDAMDKIREVDASLESNLTPYLLVLGLVGLTTWTLQKLIYNVYFHPLSRFPGPKAAAATKWWKAFQDVVLAKSFQDVLERCHATYGKGHKEANCSLKMGWSSCES